MKARYIDFSSGATPPHEFTKGLVLNAKTAKEHQAIAYFVENCMGSTHKYSMTFVPTITESVIWVSARTDFILQTQLRRVVSRIENEAKSKLVFSN